MTECNDLSSLVMFGPYGARHEVLCAATLPNPVYQPDTRTFHDANFNNTTCVPGRVHFGLRHTYGRIDAGLRYATSRFSLCNFSPSPGRTIVETNSRCHIFRAVFFYNADCSQTPFATSDCRFSGAKAACWLSVTTAVNVQRVTTTIVIVNVIIKTSVQA